ncbi:hypothetical protein ACS6X0_08915 [Streptococcus suis]|uniref:Uncharacterized protein n=1 Tax=Streptococcus suis TaxID=1307 RepID=A0A0Z8LEU8_STRSU|nr:hypothetical protein [Streptococcus suis]MCK3959216.1 hypothetical protein [Streptococcus suis]NQG75913.1 hypothetical protein [Streptococcus suis]NQG79663.1 hypothetical protein [Streptococcus suis]CYV89243.1 Uncharacterised protein [Streptococcus suis]CYV93836.1 Uncharacterised protein [Streptococcus suis]
MNEKKIFYYMSLFLYSLRHKKNIAKNTLFRYIYIFIVTDSYLNNSDEVLFYDELTIDSDIGIVNASQMETTLVRLRSENYIELQGFKIQVCEKLNNYCNKIQNKSLKVESDIRVISYFVNILSSYSDEIILNVFFNEPNVEDALSRNKISISLSDNKLNELLVKFQKEAEKYGKNLDYYDTFVTWLDFVFEEYLEGKRVDV